MRGADQEVARTASRRTGPRRWRVAAAEVVAARLSSRAAATVLAIANDLADRMDFDLGHVRYDLDEMVARLPYSRATVTRAVATLRELGLLAWVEHGTRANIRRRLGLGGYAGTATVYAAVIPPSFDRAHGHTVIGTGYGARIVIDRRGQGPVDNIPVPVGNSVENSPVDNGHETPSLTLVKEVGQVQMVGGFNYTPRTARRRTAALPQIAKNGSNSTDRRTPLQAAREIREAHLVRAMVNWTQKVPLRRLAYVLRPYFDRGLRAHDIAAELTGMCLGWRPQHPAAYITLQLRKQAARDTLIEESVAPADNQDWAACLELIRAQVALDEAAIPERTDLDRAAARQNWNNWVQVANAYADDPDDALDLYGTRLCEYAVRKSAEVSLASSAYA